MRDINNNNKDEWVSTFDSKTLVDLICFFIVENTSASTAKQKQINIIQTDQYTNTLWYFVRT